VIRLGVIGYGYWGPNLVRNFVDAPGAEVVAVSDLRPERLQRVSRAYPSVRTTTDYREIIDADDIDAIAIATPVSTHYELGLAALRAGKHVLIEKPMAAKAAEAAELVDEAAKRNLVLLVDHTFAYTGAVRKIRELVESRALGPIYYYDSVRVNLGLFQHDVSVLWDLAVHDLSIMNFVLGASPVAVSAIGKSHIAGQPENVAFLTLLYADDLIAHVNVNWLSPVKVRRTIIGGSNKMVVYDDLEPSEKVKVYDSGLTLTDDPRQIYQMLIGYRTGDVWSPKLDSLEALQAEARHFVDCIANGAKPVTGGAAALDVVRILEAATVSMARRGSMVELERV
jgi:predicted dehydrogenase